MSRSRKRKHIRYHRGSERDPIAMAERQLRLRKTPMVLEARHPTQEAAIAAAMAESAVGDTVEIHASDCPVSGIAEPTLEDHDECGCKPLVVHVTGARA